MTRIDPRKQVDIPLDKNEKKVLRHRWHHLLLVLSTITTALVFLLVLLVADLRLEGLDFSKYVDAQTVAKIDEFILLGFFAPIGLMVLRSIQAAQLSATGATASEHQFEQVFLITEHYAKLANLKRTPKVAIVNGGDFTSKSVANFGRSKILINSDLIDAPRPDSNDWGALRFAIAREIGHIAAGHRTMWYDLRTFVTQGIPYVSSPLHRAEEFTADRYGAILAPDAASDYFAVHAVSKDLWQDMSMWAATSAAGTLKAGQAIAGAIGNAPPTVWRVQALARLGVFQCTSIPNDTTTFAEFGEYLTRLPVMPLSVELLKNTHASFVLAPPVLPTDEVDQLVPRGTVVERLTSDFAAYRSGDTARATNSTTIQN